MSKGIPQPPPPPASQAQSKTKKEKSRTTGNNTNYPSSNTCRTKRPTWSISTPNPMEPCGVMGVFLFVAFCFFCFCFCFFFFYLDRPSVEAAKAAAPPLMLRAWIGEKKKNGGGDGFVKEVDKEMERCDFYDGEWVWDEKYPLYDASKCGFLDEGFRCEENGRPDKNYTKWRWQPNHCNLPRFDAHDMLDRLRNKRLVFVGDSIGRNQWESLLCMLSSVEADKSSIYEVNGNPITKHNGFLVFRFRNYNCTIEYYRSPFLVIQSRPPQDVPKNVITTLKLDIMDWTSSHWRDADVLIFNTGHWWNHEKTIRSGCYFQEGGDVKMEMPVEIAYKKSIDTLADWVRQEVNTSKTHVIFRTYSPVHFRLVNCLMDSLVFSFFVALGMQNSRHILLTTSVKRINILDHKLQAGVSVSGDWKTGGSCHLETLPKFITSRPQPRPWVLKAVDDVISGNVAKRLISNIDALNITQMTEKRKDGHSSRYYLGPGKLAPLFRQDCSHWCLPGVPDTWNELLYALFVRRNLTRYSSASS